MSVSRSAAAMQEIRRARRRGVPSNSATLRAARKANPFNKGLRIGVTFLARTHARTNQANKASRGSWHSSEYFRFKSNDIASQIYVLRSGDLYGT